jgi:hypothetical protein
MSASSLAGSTSESCRPRARASTTDDTDSLPLNTAIASAPVKKRSRERNLLMMSVISSTMVVTPLMWVTMSLKLCMEGAISAGAVSAARRRSRPFWMRSWARALRSAVVLAGSVAAVARASAVPCIARAWRGSSAQALARRMAATLGSAFWPLAARFIANAFICRASAGISVARRSQSRRKSAISL